jgi:hypothetical protein
MTGLHELQSEFAMALLDPARAPPRDVASHTSRTPTRRFNVYRNNVLFSLTEVLAAYFPVVVRLLGDALFEAMAADYIRTHPPSSPILSRYGSNLPDFISGYEPVGDLPYLADVARLEWLLQRAYHSADWQPLAAADLELIPSMQAARIVFHLHPSAAIMASPFPVVSIWRTNSHDAEVTPISLDAGAEAALVLRPQLEPKVIPLTSGMQAFVRALRTQAPLGEAVAFALVRDQTFDFRQAFAGLLEAGVLADFEVRGMLPVNQEDSSRHERSRRYLH